MNHESNHQSSNQNSVSPTTRKPIPAEMKEALSPEQVESVLRVLRESDPDAHAACLLMYEIGMRASEVFSIRREHFHPNQRAVVLPTGKSGGVRQFQLPCRSLHILSRRMDRRHGFFQGSTASRVSKSFRMACKMARVPETPLPGLRQTFVQHALLPGTSACTLTQVLGYRCARGFERYCPFANNNPKRTSSRGN